MKRAIVVPAILASAALDELKDWLAITTPRDDAALTKLLRAALELCEAFTGQMPLAAQCEEVLPANTSWQTLATRPVQAITPPSPSTSSPPRPPGPLSSIRTATWCSAS